MQFLLIILLLISYFTTHVLAGAERNIFNSDSGINIQPVKGLPDNCDIDSHNEFLPYKDIFTRNKELLIFNISPKNSNRQYCYAGLGKFSIQELMLYRLSFKLNKLDGKNSVFIYLSFWRNNKFISCQRMFIIAGANNAPAAMTGYFRDFATPPNADKVIIWVALSSNGNTFKAGPKLVFTEIEITPEQQLSVKKNEENLASSNLTREFINAGKGLNRLKVNIEDLSDGKTLQIIKNQEKQYPWFNIRMPEKNYYGKLVKLSFKAKGIGKFRPGIWWKKLNKSYEYINGTSILLSDKWQTVKRILYCNDPSTKGVSIAMCMGSSLVDMQIKDINFVVLASKKDL
jgi:hypothetical protein